MKNVIIAIICLFFVAQDSNAQSVRFQKLYSTTGPSNQGRSIIEQSNGDFIVSGIRSVPMSGGQFVANIYLMRIDNTGDTVWTKEIGTPTDREQAYDMIQLPNGNLLMVGSTNIPPSGASNAILVYTDISGNIIWQKEYGGSDNDYATSAVFDGQNLVVCGITSSYGAGSNDAWLLKLNLSGDTLWTKTYGGAMVDDAWSVIYDNDQYLFTGGTYSYADGQFDDAWIIKTDTSGNMIWRKTYGVKDRVDWAWQIIVTKNSGITDGYAITGVKDTEENQPGNAQGDLHFVRVDTAGNVLWDKSIAGTPWRREGFNIAQFSNGSFLLSGYKLDFASQSQQLYIVKTDNAGTVIWDTSYGQADSNYYVNGMTITNDGGWAVTGAVFHPSQPVRYVYVTKFNSGGVDVNSISSPLNDIAIYPNPVSGGKLYVKCPSSINVSKIEVYTVDGKLIKGYNSAVGRLTEIDISSLHGSLMISIYTDKGVYTQKVLHLD